MEIKPLSESVQNFVKSSSKITTFQQCVSELVYNSIDANASKITIQINVNSFNITVADNGTGIPKNNIKLIGDRYTTSKCHSEEGLQKIIKTFGFKGESLANIREMCGKLEIVTKSGSATYLKTFEDDNVEIKKIRDRPCKGTTITVKNFMISLPVRRNSVNARSVLQELKHFLERLSIRCHYIKISLKDEVENRLIFKQTTSDNVIAAFVNTQPSLDLDQFFIRKSNKDNLMITTMFYKKPFINSKAQILFINRRDVKCDTLQKHIKTLIERCKLFKSQDGTRNDEAEVSCFAYLIDIQCPYTEYSYDIYNNKAVVNLKNDKILRVVQKSIDKFIAETIIADDGITANKKLNKPQESYQPILPEHEIYGQIRGKSIKRHSEEINKISEESKKLKTNVSVCLQNENQCSENIQAGENPKEDEILSLVEGKSALLKSFLDSCYLMQVNETQTSKDNFITNDVEMLSKTPKNTQNYFPKHLDEQCKNIKTIRSPYFLRSASKKKSKSPNKSTSYFMRSVLKTIDFSQSEKKSLKSVKTLFFNKSVQTLLETKDFEVQVNDSALFKRSALEVDRENTNAGCEISKFRSETSKINTEIELPNELFPAKCNVTDESLKMVDISSIDPMENKEINTSNALFSESPKINCEPMKSIEISPMNPMENNGFIRASTSKPANACSGQLNEVDIPLNEVTENKENKSSKIIPTEQCSSSCEWVKEVNGAGKMFYINKRTGVILDTIPKQSDHFSMDERIHFVPKGFSPVMKEPKKVEGPLGSNDKEELHIALANNAGDELETVKWLKYFRSDDCQKHFHELFKSKAIDETNLPVPNVYQTCKWAKNILDNNLSFNFRKDLFEGIDIIAQCDNKFIVALVKTCNLIVFFDQHAVDERIRLEALIEEYKKEDNKRKSIKYNIVLNDCTETELFVLGKAEKSFASFGLCYRIFKKKSFLLVTHVPTYFYSRKNSDGSKSIKALVKHFIEEMTEKLLNGQGAENIDIPIIILEILKSEACRGALKFGTKISIEKCTEKIQTLSKCSLPFQCAHGRPTLAPVFECLPQEKDIKFRPLPRLKNLK